MLRTLIGTTALAAGLLLSSTAQAQVAPQGAVCGERGKFLTHSGKHHKESPDAMGVTASGRVIEVLTSSGGSWTIIMTHPNGVTCMVAAGQAWEDVQQVAMGPTT